MPIIALTVLVVSATASAQESRFGQEVESPQYGMFELKLGPYTPAVDDNPSLSGKPYKEIFGGDTMLFSSLEIDWQFVHPPGISLAIGGSAGFMQTYANSTMEDTGEKSADYTVLNVIPLAVLLVARVDAMADYLGVPIVPYLKLGINWYVWWVLGAGETASYSWTGSDGSTHTEKGRGGTLGWQITPGIAFRLDGLDKKAARNFDNEIGINHTYLFVEMLWAFVDHFGNNDHMNLSTDTFAKATVLGGLGFEF